MEPKQYIYTIPMNIIKNLTPEQLQALSPECLAVLMNDEHYEEDIQLLNQMLDDIDIQSNKPPLKLGPDFNDVRIRHLPEIQKILSKYPNKKFYVMYEYPNTTTIHTNDKKTNYVIPNKQYVTSNIFSETEIKGILPSPINIEKISYHGGEKPYDFISYPLYYGKDPEIFSISFTEKGHNFWYQGHKNVEGLTCITQLAKQFDNLWFIHPELLKYSKIYQHFSL